MQVADVREVLCMPDEKCILVRRIYCKALQLRATSVIDYLSQQLNQDKQRLKGTLYSQKHLKVLWRGFSEFAVDIAVSKLSCEPHHWDLPEVNLTFIDQRL